ncbi:CHASE domain-containing protein [Dactylosporangium aurantiacum]|uniref:Sensor-like histidine kinase SenX3 n=1 Tax=Dactylosporangium aurantiacum TaxID=35754 RepID=A0A9Q9IQV6_9ACTN|nr:ATP-binding protein [Dactylosporangium aurantiacum]MDG6103252.1 ATP-binding protein [Dactylosporangium aurantiacum]UWZ57754.1 CHASE domain-containing protein [Dactylosporangium aurantiacum]
MWSVVPRAGVLATLVAALAAAVSVGAGVVLDRAQERELTQALDRKVSAVAAAVVHETGRYVDTLRTVAAAAGAFEPLTAGNFAQAVEPLRHMGLAGATSIAFMVPAQDGDVDRVQALWRQRGVPDLTLTPAGPGPGHIFSIFSEAFDGTTAGAVGIDVTQAETPARALWEARRSGGVTVSDTYLLIRDRGLPEDQRQKSFVLTAPVYGAPGSPRASDPAGVRPFLGWVLMGLRGQDFIAAAVRRTTQDTADVTLTAPDADGAPAVVAAVRAHSDRRRTEHRTADVAVAQARWRLRISVVAADLPGAGPFPAAMSTAGLGLGGLLAALTFVLGTRQARADALVVAATARLRRTEAEAREHADLLTAVVDSVSDGVGVVDERGRFLLHNPAARALLGVEDSQTGAESWQEHYGIFRVDGTTPFPSGELPLARALAGEPSEQVPMVIRNAANPDGIVITVSARPLHRGAGRPGAVAVFHDVTARAAAERAIAEANAAMREELTLREAAEAGLRAARDELAAERAYLRQVLDALDVAVVTCDAGGLVVHTNRAARAAIPGVDADAGVPLTVAETSRRVRLAHPDGTPFTERDLPLLVALRGGRVDGVEAHATYADGHHHVVMMHARPLRDREGRIAGAVASSYTITALRQREAELTAFAGIVAHDLRSPLTAIGGFTEYVRDSLADGGPGHEHRQEREVLDRTLATTARMRRLIDDLLGYAAARDAVLDARDLDLRAVVDDVVTERLAALAADPTSPPPQIFVGALPSVHADPALLRQLLDNLIGNALKYTPPGQPARVDVCATPQDDGWVRVDVADRGIGIPEGQHDAIFTGFHRAHRTAGYAGTGLGLAICQRVVERHGGTITASDNPGGGARLSFTLPVARSARHTRSRVPSDRPFE